MYLICEGIIERKLNGIRVLSLCEKSWNYAQYYCGKLECVYEEDTKTVRTGTRVFGNVDKVNWKVSNTTQFEYLNEGVVSN